MLGVTDETAEEFFQQRGFLVSFTVSEGFVWADLKRQDSGLVVSKYGRGHDEPSAAARAVARWRVEQGD